MYTLVRRSLPGQSDWHVSKSSRKQSTRLLRIVSIVPNGFLARPELSTSLLSQDMSSHIVIVILVTIAHYIRWAGLWLSERPHGRPIGMGRSGTLAGTDRPLPNLLSIAHHEGITNGRHSPMSLQRGKVASERVWDDSFRPFCPIFGSGCSRGALETINQSILQITFHHIHLITFSTIVT